jgi:hypothetical protein
MRISPLWLALVLPLAACADRGPIDPVARPEPRALASLTCRASVAQATIACRPAGPETGASADLIVGGQNVYVRLASSGVGYNPSDSILRADITVQSLLGQEMGTTDGVTPDAEGIRVFFASGPSVSNGTGNVAVNNADGTATFTAADQPYFQYPEVLQTEVTSAPQEWRFKVDPTVETFVFGLYVSAAVPHEQALQQIDFSTPQLAVGGYHSCAIETDQDAYCWGADADGQMGSATTDSVPVLVDGGHAWRTITGGRFHTCGITVAGQGYCWGDNQTSQLGNPLGDAFGPTLIGIEALFRQIDAGAGHTCGVTTDEDIYCWGDGTAGQLGNGDSATTSTPVLVLGGRHWVSVQAGTDHTCAVTRGGAAFCWGDNSNGELGTGGNTPTARPVLVSGDHSWKSVSAGESFSCGVTSLGVGMCWGVDSNGQIGNGAAAAPNNPEAVSGGLTWTQINAGRQTACGVTTTGDGYCWGFNNTGEIGDGTTTESEVPVAVSGGATWSRIMGGDYHTCGGTGTEVRCWGFGQEGQLGRGDTENNPFPGPVAGGHTWEQ